MVSASVRTRLAVATALPSLALLLTYLFGLPKWSLFMEDRVLVNIAASALRANEERTADREPPPPVLPDEIAIYRGADQLPTDLVPLVHNLTPGIHERVDYEVDGKVTDLFIAVGSGATPSDRVVVVLDTDKLETFEFRPTTVLPIVAISASSLCLLIGGIALTRSVSRSLRALSDLTRPEHAVAPPVLPDDELGNLGRDWLQLRNELQQAADRRRRFARNVSHELRTPITVASGALELMRRHHPERDQREDQLLHRIESALMGMRELVEVFMGVAEGATAGNYGRCQLGDLVTELVAEIASTNALPDGKLAVACSADGPNPVPRVSMAIVVRHVILNALRHAPADATIHIAVEDGMVRVSNPVRRDAAREPRRRHGVGLEILSELVDSIGWSVSAGRDDDQFVISVAMDGRFGDINE